MNTLTPVRGNTAVASLADLGKHLAKVRQAMTSTSVDPFLKLDKDTHKWVYGIDAVNVEAGSLWAVHPLTVEHGWVCWGPEGGNKLGERMVPLTEDKPDIGSLPDTGHDWQEQIGFTLACVTGSDKGTNVRYSATSFGGRKEAKNLLGEIIDRINADVANGNLDPATSEIVPVVSLESDFYNHKNRSYGKIYFPIFNVHHWGTLNNQDGPATPAAAPETVAAAAAPMDAPRRRMRQRA